MKAENLAGIYKEIATNISVDTAVQVHSLLKGQQVIFPQRLYNKNYIRDYIRENYNGRNIRELSQMFGYSDRRVRQILNEKGEEEQDE